MNIKDVQIINWEAPGREWWVRVQGEPEKQLIHCTMEMELSYEEYQELLGRNKGHEQPC